MRNLLDLSKPLFYSNQPTNDRIEWLISSTRVVLVGFWLLAAYFEPFEEPGYAIDVGEVLLVYFAIAAAVAFLAFAGVTNKVSQALIHSADIAIITLLLYLTRGPLSPFFLFVSFVLFSGTLRWGWRGAAATALLLSIATGLLAWQAWNIAATPDDDFEFELNRILLRIGFLVMSGVMLMWFGYTHETASMRLARLAAWPSPASDGGDRTADAPLAATLAHIAKVMNAPRILIWCKWKDKPETETWLWTMNGSLHHERRVARSSETLWRENPDGTLPVAANEPDRRRAVLGASFTSDVVAGGISLPDRTVWSTDDAFMMEIIVSRVRLELEHQQLREEHETYAALRERAGLARDLHDGVLQTLTASRLQLSQITSDHAVDFETIQNVSKMLQDEQRRLREFRVQLLTPPPAVEVALKQLQEDTVARQQRLWQCAITIDISPPAATVSTSLGSELNFMISEAIGNAARRGKATQVRVRITKQWDELLLEICDNGRGLTGDRGKFSHDELLASGIGPSSLMARTRSLNGAIALSTSSKGVALRIRVPLSVGV